MATNVLSRTGRARREAILTNAARAFLEEGYGISIDRVAERAGVSKQTVYNHFGSKEDLFGEVVSLLIRDLTAPLDAAPDDSDPETVLRQLARQSLAMALEPEYLNGHRLMVAEAQRFPEFAAMAYEAGVARVTRSLANYLADQTTKGRLAVKEATLAAEHFFGMVTGHIHLRALMGSGPALTPDQLDHHIDLAVATFLRAYRPS